MNQKVEELRGSGKSLLEKFLDQLPSAATKEAYELGMKRFCHWLKVSPEELVALRKEGITDESKETEMQQWLERYYREAISVGVESPEVKNRARGKSVATTVKQAGIRVFSPMSAQLTIAAVRQFLKFQGRKYTVEFHASQKAKPKRKGFLFDRPQLQKILGAATLKDQCLYLFGIAGLDAESVVILEKDVIAKTLDRTRDGKPFRIWVHPRGKTKVDMFTCISSELERKLRLYLPTVKGEFLFPGYQGSKMDKSSPNASLNVICKKLGIQPIDPETEQVKYHGLRRYLDNQASHAGMAYAAVEQILGHELPHDGAYKAMSEEGVWQEFLKVESALTVEVNIQTNGLSKTVEALQKQVDGLTAQLAESTTRTMEELQGLDKILKENEALRKKVADLEQKKS